MVAFPAMLTLVPGQPEFPVSLGDESKQTDDSSDYGRQVYDTQRGKQSTRDTPKPQPTQPIEEFGRFNV